MLHLYQRDKLSHLPLNLVHHTVVGRFAILKVKIHSLHAEFKLDMRKVFFDILGWRVFTLVLGHADFELFIQVHAPFLQSRLYCPVLLSCDIRSVLELPLYSRPYFLVEINYFLEGHEFLRCGSKDLLNVLRNLDTSAVVGVLRDYELKFEASLAPLDLVDTWTRPSLRDVPLHHEVWYGSLAEHHLIVDPDQLVLGSSHEEIEF